MNPLKEMVENLVNERPEDAQINFHSYMNEKMKELTKTDNTEDEK